MAIYILTEVKPDVLDYRRREAELIFRRIGMHRVARGKRSYNRGKTHLITIIQILFSLDRVRLQGIDDLVLALGNIGLAGLFLVQLDHYFIVTGVAVTLDNGIVQPGLIKITANGFGIALGGLLGFGIGHIRGALPSWKYELRRAKPKGYSTCSI